MGILQDSDSCFPQNHSWICPRCRWWPRLWPLTSSMTLGNLWASLVLNILIGKWQNKAKHLNLTSPKGYHGSQIRKYGRICFQTNCGMSRGGVEKKELRDNELFWKLRLGKLEFSVVSTTLRPIRDARAGAAHGTRGTTERCHFKSRVKCSLAGLFFQVCSNCTN